MAGSMILDEICQMLETYKGRDKIIRTLCYTSKLVGAMSPNDEYRSKLFKFSSQMSATRATLRLFDDLPMLKYSLEYGLGKEEPDGLMAFIGVTSNVVDQIFYPIEKVSWFTSHDLIPGNPQPWDIASSLCWVATIYLSMIKTLRHFCILQKAKSTYKLDGKIDELIQITMKERMELVTFTRLILDFVHAVHTLPAGFLWSSQLKVWQVGLIGTISSILGIYQMFAKRKLAEKCKPYK